MTFLYENSDTCREHGFALSPDKTCVRCRSEAAELERRKATRRLLAAGGVMAVLLAGTVVWASTRPKPEAPLPPIPAMAPAVAEGEAVPEHPLPKAEAPVTSPETHAVLDAWQAEMARVQAERDKELAAEANAQALAEKKRMEEALEGPTVSSYARGGDRGRGQQRGSSSSSTDHPSWWQDQPMIRGRTRGSIAAQQRQMAAAGVAPYDVTNPNAWLPPNNGGNFSNKNAPASH